MVITLQDDCDREAIKARLQGLGLWANPVNRDSTGPVSAFVVERCSQAVPSAVIRDIPGVLDVLAPPSVHPKLDALVGAPADVGEHAVGGGAPPLLMAGPCGVESQEQIEAAAAMVAACGATILRGGAFKPRTSPYSFAGAGREALAWLRDAADNHGLGVVTEIMSEAHVEAVTDVADLLQIGSRNMQNFALLHRVGSMGKPVLLKRGMSATVDEWLLAGEHLLNAGAASVVFCERGIQSFTQRTRNLLDLSAVALLKHVYGLPVIVDPSHGSGRRDLIGPMSRAAIAAGADGLIIEAHPNPAAAKSDGPQAMQARALQDIAASMGVLAKIVQP